MSSVATHAPALHRSTIPDGLRRAASKYRGRTALTFSGRTWSFAEIDAAAGRVAHRLAGLGLKKGDRVGAYAKIPTPISCCGSAACASAWCMCRSTTR